MHPEEIKEIIGADAESRFHSACSVRTEETPDWFLRIKDGGLFWDIRGIDAFAYITPKNGGRRVEVPIQIKSSERAARQYAVNHGDKVGHVVMIIVGGKTYDEIRADLYAQLRTIRDSEVRYDDFLRAVQCNFIPSQVSRRIIDGARRIRKYRLDIKK